MDMATLTDSLRELTELLEKHYQKMFQVLRKAEFESIILKHFHKLPAIPYEIETVI